MDCPGTISGESSSQERVFSPPSACSYVPLDYCWTWWLKGQFFEHLVVFGRVTTVYRFPTDVLAKVHDPQNCMSGHTA